MLEDDDDDGGAHAAEMTELEVDACLVYKIYRYITFITTSFQRTAACAHERIIHSPRHFLPSSFQRLKLICTSTLMKNTFLEWHSYKTVNYSNTPILHYI